MSEINLHNQDCMEAMANMPDRCFDLAIVDPPYGIDFAKTYTGKGWIIRESKDWDKEIPGQDYFKHLFRVSINQIIWGGNYFVKFLPPSMGWVFWDKGQREFSLADGELAFSSFDRALRVFSCSRSWLNKVRGGNHPTEKPSILYKWLIQNYAKPGDRILDTHLGSGSIAIACHDLDFDLEGYEIDKDYYNAACDRLKRHQAQMRLF